MGNRSRGWSSPPNAETDQGGTLEATDTDEGGAVLALTFLIDAKKPVIDGVSGKDGKRHPGGREWRHDHRRRSAQRVRP